MKQQQYEARVSREASKTVQVHIGVDGNTLQQRIATTIICHKEASLKNSSGEIKPAERQSKWRKFKWRVNENMQGKDVKAASETNIFYRDLPFASVNSLLCGPLHGYQEEHFLRSKCPCEPKSIQFTEFNVQNDITLKGGIANLVRSHRLPRVFNNFHKFP